MLAEAPTTPGITSSVDIEWYTSEGRLIGVEDGTLYAHGSTTCFLFPLAEAQSGK